MVPDGEKFGCDPDRLPSILPLNGETPGQTGKEPAAGLLPEDRPVSKNRRGEIPEPGGLRSGEPGVLLIDGNGRSRKRERFFGEGPVMAVRRNRTSNVVRDRKRKTMLIPEDL